MKKEKKKEKRNEENKRRSQPVVYATIPETRLTRFSCSVRHVS